MTTRPSTPPLPGDWRGLVVFFGGTPWDGQRLPDQHMAAQLARWAPVLYVDPPVSVVSHGDGWQFTPPTLATRPRLLDERLARFTPVVVPPKGRGPMRRLTERILRRSVARVVRQLTDDVAVAVSATLPLAFGVCGERRRVLYATDEFRAGASLMGIPEEWLVRRDRELLRAADDVIAVSEHLADRLRARSGVDPVVIENGVDHAAFAASDQAPWPADVTLPSPIAGFVGYLSDRIDLPMLEATAASGCSLLLVGPRQSTFDLGRIERLLSRPNVQWVGPRPFEQLPAYVRTMDVGLLPYADTEFNRASSPLKVLEYLSAGRPAVVTDLPALRSLGDVVRIESTAASFAAAVTELLAEPRDPGEVARRQAAAAARSWDEAGQRFARAIGILDN